MTPISPEPRWLARVLEWFEKDPGDAFVGSVELHGASLGALQHLWKVPSDDPMLECYAVGEPQRSAVEDWAGIPLDLAQFDYFICSYTRDWEATQLEGGFMGRFPPPAELPAFPEARLAKPRE